MNRKKIYFSSIGEKKNNLDTNNLVIKKKGAEKNLSHNVSKNTQVKRREVNSKFNNNIDLISSITLTNRKKVRSAKKKRVRSAKKKRVRSAKSIINIGKHMIKQKNLLVTNVSNKNMNSIKNKDIYHSTKIDKNKTNKTTLSKISNSRKIKNDNQVISNLNKKKTITQKINKNKKLNNSLEPYTPKIINANKKKNYNSKNKQE